jgi:hypothetical protein
MSQVSAPLVAVSRPVANTPEPFSESADSVAPARSGGRPIAEGHEGNGALQKSDSYDAVGNEAYINSPSARIDGRCAINVQDLQADVSDESPIKPQFNDLVLAGATSGAAEPGSHQIASYGESKYVTPAPEDMPRCCAMPL